LRLHQRRLRRCRRSPSCLRLQAGHRRRCRRRRCPPFRRSWRPRLRRRGRRPDRRTHRPVCRRRRRACRRCPTRRRCWRRLPFRGLRPACRPSRARLRCQEVSLRFRPSCLPFRSSPCVRPRPLSFRRIRRSPGPGTRNRPEKPAPRRRL